MVVVWVVGGRLVLAAFLGSPRSYLCETSKQQINGCSMDSIDVHPQYITDFDPNGQNLRTTPGRFKDHLGRLSQISNTIFVACD